MTVEGIKSNLFIYILKYPKNQGFLVKHDVGLILSSFLSRFMNISFMFAYFKLDIFGSGIWIDITLCNCTTPSADIVDPPDLAVSTPVCRLFKN